MPNYFKMSLLWISLIHSAGAWGHHDDDLFDPTYGTLTWGVEASGGFRSGSRNNETWQIPGLLMGGESERPNSNTSLDNLNMNLDFQHLSGVFLGLDIGQHHGDTLSLEEGLIGWQDPQKTTTARLGRMKATFNQTLMSHPSSRTFSRNTLLDDAFWGGHYTDEGINVEHKALPWITVGADVWQGDAYPATSGKKGGAQDVYVQLNPNFNRLNALVKLWAWKGASYGRFDTRVGSSGHNHGSAVSSSNEEIRFSGDLVAWGAYTQGTAPLSPSVNGSVQAGWIHIESDGDLEDPTRQVDLESQHQGFWISTAVSFNEKHRFALRYSALDLDNEVSGTGAASLAKDSYLLQIKNTPDIWEAAYLYFWRPGMGIRFEWIKDQTTLESDEYVGLGVFLRFSNKPTF